MATIRDIARAAGVSQGTVSNVLNGRDIVSSDKIQRVMKAVDEMGYTINEKAQVLRKGSTKTLAAVVPNLYDRPYVDFYASFKHEAERSGYQVDLYTSDDDAECEHKIITRLRSRMTNGIAVHSAITDGSTAYYDAGFSQQEVLFVSRRQGFESRFIGFDLAVAGVEMAKAAAERKYKSVALITGSLEQFSKRTFSDAFISSMGKLLPDCKIYTCVTNSSYRYKNAVRMFTHCDGLQAVFAENIALAQVADNVNNNFYHNDALDIYTVAPASIIPDNNFIRYEIDCRLLGKRAAQQLIEQSKNAPLETILPPKGFSSLQTGRKPLNGKTLSIATIGSPTTRALQSLIRLFTEATGTNVHITEFSSNSLYNIMKNWGMATPYDIVRLDVGWLNLFAQKAFEPLEQIDGDIKNRLVGFLPSVLHKYSETDGTLFALPGTPSVQLLFYRKDLFDNSAIKRLYYERHKQQLAPPKTYAEYNKIAEFFTQSLNPDSPVKYGTTIVAGDADLVGAEFLMRYFSHTQVLFDESGISRLAESDAAKHALAELTGAAKCASGTVNKWWTDAAQEFSRGETAMTIQLINHVSDLVGPDSLVSESIGWSAVPGNNPMLGGSVLGISKYSQHKEDALDFLKWISSDNIATANTLLGGMSAKTATYDNCEITDNYPWLPFARDSFKNSHIEYCAGSRKTPLEIRNIQSLIGLAVMEVLNGHLSNDEALHFADTALNSVLTGKG